MWCEYMNLLDKEKMEDSMMWIKEKRTWKGAGRNVQFKSVYQRRRYHAGT